jgi:hypothetical protein
VTKEQSSAHHQPTTIFSSCASVRFQQADFTCFRKIRQVCLELLASIRIFGRHCCSKQIGGRGGGLGDGSHGGYSGQEKGAKEQMAKEKCKAIEFKSAGTQHRLRRPSAQKLLQEGRAPKRPGDLIVAMQFKPFGSTLSGQLSMNCKSLYG